ncbi:MAG TPA: hypothetical protein DCM02_11610 [Flavobacterium sp.]|nr:hypothetical protein [Flavobacterium sp.]
MSKLDVRIGSDLDYEDLVADVYYQDQFLFTIQQEEGFENLKVEFFPQTSAKHSKLCEIPLEELLKAIEHAKKRLWELRKSL